MMEAHLNRDKAIKTCIAQTSEVVEKLREQRAQDSENLGLIKQLRKEQTKVRLPMVTIATKCLFSINGISFLRSVYFLFLVKPKSRMS